MDEITSIKEELNKWYELNCNNGNLSWKALGRLAKRDPSYISKLAKGVHKPSYEVEIDLLRAMYQGNVRSVFKYLKKKYPDKTAEIESLMKGDDKSTKFTSHSYRDIVNDRATYRIFRLSSMGTFSPDSLSQTVGAGVSAKIKYLEGLDLVQVIDGNVVRSISNTTITSTSMEDVVAGFKHNLDIVDEKHRRARMGHSDDFDSKKNKLWGIYEGVSEDFQHKLVTDVTKFISEKREEALKDENRGDIPMFLNIATGRLDDK